MSVNKTNQEELLQVLSNESYEQLMDKLIQKWLESLQNKMAQEYLYPVEVTPWEIVLENTER